MTEIWRDVVGFENYFQISNFGNVLSKRTGKLLKQGTSKSGYRVISTRVGGRTGKCHYLKVHRLVADAFLLSPSEDLVAKCAAEHHGKVIVRHLDDDKANNVPANLAWGTNQDNVDDFKRSSVYADWLEHLRANPPRAKASPELREYIRARYCSGSRVDGARALAQELGIHHTNIAKIAAGRSYK